MTPTVPPPLAVPVAASLDGAAANVRPPSGYSMLGAITGDVVGSVHEWAGTKTKAFPLFTPASSFTDDTVLTIAVAECLLDGGGYVNAFHRWTHAYPGAGYGGRFAQWAFHRRRDPYNSMGNGSAMRVSPVAWAFDALDDVLDEARRSAVVTHDHEEGVRGALATAAAVFLARKGEDKPTIRREVERIAGYDLSRTLDELRPGYVFDSGCPGSVPQSIIAFLESESYEDALRNAISLGGDADTMAAIAGAIAEPFYGGVPADIQGPVLERLDDDIRSVIARFSARFGG